MFINFYCILDLLMRNWLAMTRHLELNSMRQLKFFQMNISEAMDLKTRCILFNEFIIQEGNLPYEQVESINAFNQNIINACLHEDTQLLQSLNYELNNVIGMLPYPMFRKVRRMFHDHLGEYLIYQPTLQHSISGSVTAKS